MARKSAAKSAAGAEPRSGCPVSISLELLGDRWSLLIIRDLMVRACRTFHEFQNSGEGIASNILSSRLRRLKAAGLVTTEPLPEDRRSLAYRLTEKGIALAPLLLELLIWGANNNESAAPAEFIRQCEANRQAVLDETIRRWRERDPRPLIPPFPSRKSESKSKRTR